MRESFFHALHLAKDQTEMLIFGISLIVLGLALVVFDMARSARDD